MSQLAAILTIGLALVLAGPATAHVPEQHDAQRLSYAETKLTGQSPLSPMTSFACEDGAAGPFPCRNVDMAGFVPLPMLGGATGNDVWGWTDPKSKREFAIIGTSTSTGFVEVTDPDDPRLVGILPTRGVPDLILWRDIKVSGHHAFIVSEITDSGLQILDLRRLLELDGPPALLTKDAAYDEFSSAHNISINTETEFAYVVGSDTCAANGERGGLHMVDIAEPTKPRFAGCATVPTSAAGEPDNYVHDVECTVYRGPDRDHEGREICFGSNEDVVAIYDVTDKSAPRVLSTTHYPTAHYTHQGALTDDQRWFLFGDELDEQGEGSGTVTYILDVSDLDDPPAPKPFEHETGSIDHNMYVHGDKVFQSNYMAGLRILEFDDASLTAGQLREVGFFDVVPGADVAEFAGTWSNFRFPRSGTTVVSTIENQVSGLFVLQPKLDGKKPKDGRQRRGR